MNIYHNSVPKIKRENNHEIDFDYKIVETKDGKECSKRLLMNKEFKDIFEFWEFHNEHWTTKQEPLTATDSWVFGKNLNEKITDELLNQGNCLDELADMVVKVREELSLGGLDMFEFNNKACKRQRRFSEDGDELDIDRYISDDINMWSNIRRTKKKDFIRLVLNFGMNADASLEDFARNTALAYCTTEILENLGYSVEIIGTANSRDCFNPRFLKSTYGDELGNVKCWISESSVSFTIKQFDDMLDLRAIGMSTLPALFRKYSFDIRKTIYGSPYGSTFKHTKEFSEFIGSNLNIGRCYSRDSKQQIEHISKVIKEITD